MSARPKAADITIAGVQCDRRKVVRAIRRVSIDTPGMGGSHAHTLTGTRAIGAVANTHSSTVSRRLSAGGVLGCDSLGMRIESAILAHIPSTGGGDLARTYGSVQAVGGAVLTGQPIVQPTERRSGNLGRRTGGVHPDPQSGEQRMGLVDRRGTSTVTQPPAGQQTPGSGGGGAQQVPTQPTPSAPPAGQGGAQPASSVTCAACGGPHSTTSCQWRKDTPADTPEPELEGAKAKLFARIRKPLLDTRAAIRDGSLDSVCGLRKAALVCKILGVLDANGWNAKDALAAAYYSAVVAKEPSDLRLHVVEPFVSEFGFEPALPAADAVLRHPTRQGDWLHPCVPLLAALLRAGVHTWLYGEAGVGKSRAARDAAGLIGRASLTFACHKHTHTDDALGGKELVNGSTVDRLGPWPTAMAGGMVLILEEPSKAHPGVLAAAHAMLEERELALPNMAGTDGASTVVRAADGFVVVAADNAEAGRDPGRYVAVQQMDPAFLDRFAMVEVGELPASAELAIMEDAYTAGVASEAEATHWQGGTA